jgi:hypothetical protein
MPNKAIQNAKRLRGGALGQSSRFYNIYGQQVGASNPDGFKGGQGWTAPKPQIGSMLSLGIMKQNKNAGGNNVCQPGPGPKNKCVSKEGNNNLTVGFNGGTPGTDGAWGFSSGAGGTPVGATFGSFNPSTINGYLVNVVVWADDAFGTQNLFIVDLSGNGTTNPPDADAFTSISFINCDDNTVRTYTTTASTSSTTAPLIGRRWQWRANESGFSPAEEDAYWAGALNKTLKVVIDDNTLAPTGNGTGDYCCKNSDCDCRGPSGTCPCRSKVDANGIRKHC